VDYPNDTPLLAAGYHWDSKKIANAGTPLITMSLMMRANGADMAKITHIRGLLLEEAILHLLRATGYSTVESKGTDPTLHAGPAGLEVKGRGGRHQIDAIADFLISQPFSNPQRLLVEAKCYSASRPVDLPIVRNAVGVLKDVSEYWVTTTGTTHKRRYHYQYALFSASTYTDRAELYAFAQDIYLIPLAGSAYFRPVIQSIQDVTAMAFGGRNRQDDINVDLKTLRQGVRNVLKDGELWQYHLDTYCTELAVLEHFLDSCFMIDFALLAVLGGSFPVFLVPSRSLDLRDFLRQQGTIYVQITWDRNNWYIADGAGKHIFSFDLPPQLFKLYGEDGTLTQRAALALKEGIMSHFQAVHSVNGDLRVMNFQLDPNWFERVKERLNEERKP
jgi:hypothetical protein